MSTLIREAKKLIVVMALLLVAGYVAYSLLIVDPDVMGGTKSSFQVVGSSQPSARTAPTASNTPSLLR